MKIKSLLLLSLLISGIFALSKPSQASPFVFDEGTSEVTFTIKHFGITTLAGKFQKFSGRFVRPEEHGEVRQGEIAIDSASMETPSEPWNERLRSPQYFWAKKHPLITFQSQKFDQKDEYHFDMHGTLTIRGVPVPATFELSRCEIEAAIACYEGFAYIKRIDYGLGTGGAWDALGRLANEKLMIGLKVYGEKEEESATAPLSSSFIKNSI